MKIFQPSSVGGGGGSVNSVTASLPLTSSGGTNPNIALNQPAATRVWYSDASGNLIGDALFTRLSSTNHDTNIQVLNNAAGQTGLSLISGTSLATLSSVDNTGAGGIVTVDANGNIIAQTGAFGNFTVQNNSSNRIFNTAVGSGDVEIGDIDGVFNGYQYILSQSTSEHVFIGSNYQFNNIDYVMPSVQGTTGQSLTIQSVTLGVATLDWETVSAGQGQIQWQYATSDIGAPGDATTIDLEGTSFSPSAISGNTLTIRGLNGATGYAGAETFLGSDAGQGASVSNTTMIGVHSGDGATNADNAITIGNNAGFHAINAHDSIFIGNTVAYVTRNASNSIFIGNNIEVGGTIDNTSTTGVTSIILISGTFSVGDTVTSTSGGTGTIFAVTPSPNNPSGLQLLNITGGATGFNNADTITDTTSGATATVSTTYPTFTGGTFNSILIGDNTSTAGYINSVAIGNSAINTMNNQFMIGSTALDFFGGQGITYITSPQYISTRDDTAGFTPVNFIFNDDAGNFLSAPISALGVTPLIGQTSGLISNPAPIGSDNETYLGYQAGLNSNPDTSTYIGYQAGMGNITASTNTALGWMAGAGQSGTAGENVSLGASAGLNATNATGSEFIGNDAGQGATNAQFSIFIGNGVAQNDMVDNTGGSKHSILIGDDASTNGFSNSIGLGTSSANTATNQLMIGDAGGTSLSINQITVPTYPNTRDDTGTFTPTNLLYTDNLGNILSTALSSVGITPLIGQTSGLVSNPTPLGSTETWLGALAGDTGGSTNNTTFIGYSAGQLASAADASVFIGGDSGGGATNASGSVFIGTGSGGSATNASASTFIGQNAGSGAFNAANSIFIGDNAASGDFVDNTSGSHSILIGDSTSTANFVNSVAIGTGAVNTAANQFLISSPGFPFTDIALNTLGTFRFGDINNDNHSTTILGDDSAQTITFNANNGFIFNQGKITIDTVPYVFPSTQGLLNQSLINDGSGNLNWEQVPITQGGQDQTGNTGTQTLVVLSITGTHTLQINPYLTVTAISAGTLTMMVNYTDETNTSRSITLVPQGLTSGVVNATGVYLFPATTIRSNSATNVTVTVIFSGVSTTWDGGAYIIQLN